MRELLMQLDQFTCDWRAAAEIADIRKAEHTLGFTFPADLLALYRHHDGADPTTQCRPWRLMPLEEVVAMHVIAPTQWSDLEEANEWLPWRRMNVQVFWSDDNSNYGGIYADGPLAGTICFIDHEDPDFSPCHRSVESFMRAVVDSARLGDDWYNMRSEWPSDQHVEQDRAMAGSLKAKWESLSIDDWRRTQVGLALLKVLPLVDSGRIVPYLDDMDMWVQARAADELGNRKYFAAIPDLTRIAEHGMHNGRSAAVLSLGKLATAEALEELLRLTNILPEGYGALLGLALKSCGCETKVDARCCWRYRPPGAAEWRPLR